MRRFCFYLSLGLLLLACKKTNNRPENLLIRYTFDEGFTGISKHYIIATSKELARKHELSESAHLVILSKPEMQEIIQRFEENHFEDIKTQIIPTNDRGGVLIEVRYLKPEMRIVKADLGQSFVQKDDKEQFNRCKAIVEKYLNLE